jgi:hypothetical protein
MNWYWLIGYCLLSAFAMSYGWVYRGSVGHEAGAMVPGALLGLMLCVGSGRADWHRRAVVVGLFGAAGWAWGGSVSYMEHTFYMFSDSFIDIYYAYAMIFFIAALWAGCGLLTQVLGLRLAPLHRSESWGGILGVLITLIIYLIRKNNYAAFVYYVPATLTFCLMALFIPTSQTACVPTNAVPLHFKDRNIYIAWPPNTQQEGFLVFSRVGDDDTAGD